MLNSEVLTFQEFVMHESLPLSKIHGAVLEFLQGREDVVLFGAQAVNAYVSEPRMTQDIDLLSVRAAEFSEELREHLSETFHIAAIVREIGEGKGFRIYQTRKEGNRHLVDVRPVENFPATETIEKIRILSPLELIASKVVSYHARRGRPKSGTDWRDLGFLLLRFLEVKEKVAETLQAKNVGEAILQTWAELEGQNLELEDEDEDLIF